MTWPYLGGYREEERGLGLFFSIAPYGLSTLISPHVLPLVVSAGGHGRRGRMALSGEDPLHSST